MYRDALLAAAAILGGGYLFFFVRFWVNQGKHLAHESGYAPPIPRLWARVLRSVVSKIVAPFWVGPITAEGGQTAKAQAKRRRFVVVVNHQRYTDAVACAKLAGLLPWRFMVAMEEVRRPLMAPLYATVGAIPVIRPGSEAAKQSDAPMRDAANAILGAVNALKKDSEAGPKEKGAYATVTLAAFAVVAGLLHWFVLCGIATAIAVLGIIDLVQKRKTHFVIFPQGKLIASDELKEEDFHNGPIKIAKRLQKETGEDVAILPMHLRYLESRGAHAVIGEPIDVATLPKKDDQAAKLVFEAMCALKARSLSRAS